MGIGMGSVSPDGNSFYRFADREETQVIPGNGEANGGSVIYGKDGDTLFIDGSGQVSGGGEVSSPSMLQMLMRYRETTTAVAREAEIVRAAADRKLADWINEASATGARFDVVGLPVGFVGVVDGREIPAPMAEKKPVQVTGCRVKSFVSQSGGPNSVLLHAYPWDNQEGHYFFSLNEVSSLSLHKPEDAPAETSVAGQVAVAQQVDLGDQA